jgi:CBS domain-containing protein
MKVKDIMSTDPACCSPETKLQDVAKLMVEHDCGEIPVCDGAGRTVGVVTDRDIVCRMVAKGLDPTGRPARECMSSPVITCTSTSAPASWSSTRCGAFR